MFAWLHCNRGTHLGFVLRHWDHISVTALLEMVMRTLAEMRFQELTKSRSCYCAMVSTHQACYNRRSDIMAFKANMPCELYYWDYEPAVGRLSVLSLGWDPNTDCVSPDKCSYVDIIVRTCQAVRRHSLSFQ